VPLKNSYVFWRRLLRTSRVQATPDSCSGSAMRPSCSTFPRILSRHLKMGPSHLYSGGHAGQLQGERHAAALHRRQQRQQVEHAAIAAGSRLCCVGHSHGTCGNRQDG